MPVHTSCGPFPTSSAIRSRPQGELNKLFYSTSSRDQLKGNGLADQDASSENFDAIHKMGHKNSKYMKYQLKTAQLLDRNACKYTRDYVAKPLGDCECNRELAKTFRGPLTSPAGNIDFEPRSQYNDNFPGFMGKELKSAKLKNQAPHDRRTKTVGGIGESMVLASTAHNDLRPPQHGMALQCDSFIPKPNLTLSAKCNHSDTYKSMSRSEFSWPRRKTPMSSSASAPGLGDAGAETDDGVDIFSVRRAGYLSPGN